MTVEEKRIKLSEFEGWKCASHVAEFDKPFALMCWYRPGNSEWQTEEPPDYFNDLNAVHKLFQRVPQNLKSKYFAILCSQVSSLITLNGYYEATEASASKRAEAIGLTLELWEN